MSALAGLLNSLYAGHILLSLERSSSLLGCEKHTVKDPCEHCGERECPNAPKRVIPASPGILGNFEVVCEAGSMRTKARRS